MANSTELNNILIPSDGNIHANGFGDKDDSYEVNSASMLLQLN